MFKRIQHVLLGLSALFVLSLTTTAQFQDNTSQIPSGSPSNNNATENIDFGDVDLDGDWDAILADGGDSDQEQNRIWMNQGYAQGGTVGWFVDETSARLPSIQDQSRDIEFADIDNDGDLDVYVSNTSAILPQTNRWWVNSGSGSGFYVDETAARWVNLGGAGSSIANSQILGGGGFLDFSCDCDFGDLDNDGDLDLVHSSYGGVFGGNVPTRIFLNDGLGFFEEFNPSGFQMPGQEVASGQPGLWCEGTQQTSTTNSNGTNCDIASSALDIDLGDIDGDFDLDILHGARQEEPRMFENRLEDNGGVLGFRDITGSAFPSGYTSGDGHYEQEMADLDGDGDLDIYGLNWLVNFGFTDITLRGNGDGTFTGLATLSNSTADDNEGDFLDYDQDGDLDLFVANFSGQDKLYRNSNNGGSSFSLDYVNNGVPGSSSFTGLDADCCDVDEDGDTDIFVANDNGARNVFLKNTTQIADTHAPYIPNVEQAADRDAGSEPTVLRAHVYDNASYYITWYNETWVEVSVNGGSATVIPAMSSQGQIFRVEIPGSLVGTITYQWFSRDEYGNTGSSAVSTYNVGGGGFSSFCVGDFNTLVGCPCLNEAGNVGAGCENSTGQGALLSVAGVASVSADSIVFSGSDLPSGPGLYFQGNNAINGGNGNVFGDGLRCAGGSVKRLQVRFSAGGTSQTSVSISNAAGNVTAGSLRRYQLWYRDPSVSAPCQSGFNLTNGIEITWSA
jgi:hypothetical protein